MDESRQGIRIEVDGRWPTDDMDHMLLAISDLYDLRLFLELLREEWRILDRYYDDFIHRLPLASRRRRRLSPFGPIPWEFGMFGGFPPPFDEAQLLRIPRLLDPDEQEALNNERLRLENARTFVALARDLGYTEVEIRRLVAYVDVSDLNTVRDG
jgi:hypothetical protein